MSRKLIRRSTVIELTGLGDGTIRRLIAGDKFPKLVQLTPGGSVGWFEDEVGAWIESLQVVTPETQRQVAPGSAKRGRPRTKSPHGVRTSK